MATNTDQDLNDPRTEPSAEAAYVDIYIDGFDASKETMDTLTFKLALLVKAPVPRIKILLRDIPARVKKRVPVSAARRFAARLDELGVEIRLEPSREAVTKAESTGVNEEGTAPDPTRRAEGAQAAASAVVEGSHTCPQCGWERDERATHCPLCLHKYSDLFSKEGMTVDQETPQTTTQGFETARRDGEIPGWLSWIIIGSSVIVLLFVLLNYTQ